jgi:hypothetical protein
MGDLHQYKFLFWLLVLSAGGSVVFMGILMPRIVGKNKQWLIEHSRLLRTILFVVLLLSAAWTLLGIWLNK